MSTNDTLYLIDGSGFIFRAYYGIRAPMSATDGIYTTPSPTNEPVRGYAPGSVERKNLEAEVAPFTDLHGSDGVFFVTGNHDFYSGADAWSAYLTQLGIRVLRNESAVIDRGGPEASFTLAGVDDHRAGLLPGDGGEDLDLRAGGMRAGVRQARLGRGAEHQWQK